MPLTYAKARLWLGISGVGFWVLLASIWLLNANELAQGLAGVSTSASLLTLLGMYVALSFPFDWLGGYVLPCHYKRTSLSAPAYAMVWLRGVSLHGLMIGLGALLVLSVAKRVAGLPLAAGMAAIMGTIIAYNVFQLACQTRLAQLVASFTVMNASSTESVWQCDDPGFTGGLTCLGQQSILPQQWQNALSPEQVALVQQRRNALRGSTLWPKGVLAAVGFNALGAGVSYWVVATLQLLPTSAGDGGALPFLLSFAGVSTLWSFLGLLTLPTPSQRGTLQADQLAWAAADPTVIDPLLLQLDRWQDDEPKRGRWLQRVFHPGASVLQRMTALHSVAPTDQASGWYHVARHALYLSWPTLSLLSRAVHCNAGRPWLWVMLPTDG